MTDAVAPMRVLMLLDSLHTGGTELNALRQIRVLVGAGHAVTVAVNSLQGSLGDELRSLAVPVHALPAGAGPLGYVSRARAAARLARSMRADVIYAHDLTGNIVAGLVRLQQPSLRTVMSRRWERASLPKLARLNDWSYRLASVIVCNSDASRAAVIALGCDARRVVTLNNILPPSALVAYDDAERRAWRERLHIAADACVVGSVGRLRPIKGHDVLLRAWAQAGAGVAQATLVLIGDGHQRANLESLASTLGIADRVRFAGELPNSPHPATLLDVFVLPSRAEGMPNALIEALAHGVPSVASSVGGVKELAERHAVRTVPPESPDALAAALAQSVDAWMQGTARDVQAAARIRHEYSPEVALQRLVPLLAPVTSHAGRAA